MNTVSLSESPVDHVGESPLSPQTSSNADRLGPVTVTREFRVKPGHEAEFEAAIQRLVDVSIQQPGHLGVTVIRPAAGATAYRFVYRYDTQGHLREWHDSDLRAGLMEDVSPHISDDRFETSDVLSMWLDPDMPGSTGTPAKWKVLAVSWLAIYPTVTAITYIMQALKFDPPVPLRTMVLSGLVIPISAYIVLPPIQRAMNKWLHKSTH